MMTGRISLALNIVLIIAVVYLFMHEFSGSPEMAQEEEATTQDDSLEVEMRELKDTSDISSVYQPNLVVAYVNSDSINANYEYLKEKEDELIKRSQQSDARIEREMKKAERRYNELMQKAQSGGFTSEQEYQEAEMEVQELQQRIEQLRNEEANSLNQVQRELQMQFSGKVSDFLERYSNERNIDMVLSYVPGGQVLWASDSLEITKEVVKGLNAEYEAEQVQPENASKKQE